MGTLSIAAEARRLVLCSVVFGVAACSAGGGGGLGNPGDDNPGNGGGGDGPTGYDIDPPEEGDGIALLELETPDADEFVIHATVPVPPGTFPREDGQVPFAVLDQDLTPVPSQVEPVAWHADLEEDGASVVEVIALVQRNPAKAPGSRSYYPIIFSPHAPAEAELTNEISVLAEATFGVPSSVSSLLADSNSVVFRVRDVFGNKYEHVVLDTPYRKLVMGGRATTELATYGALLPTPPVNGPQGTLPHLMGIHAYLGTHSGYEALTLDLRVNNGQDGTTTAATFDDALGKVYFESLELVVPNGWAVQQAYDDPFFGNPYSESGKRVYPIVEPLSGGKMHMMPWQAQFQRRLVLTPTTALDVGRRLLDSEGQAFCKDGRDPQTGEPLYSWWNPGTAFYFSQHVLLPSLVHIGIESIRNAQQGKFNELKNIVKNGTNKGGYPIEASVLGWAHPFGVGYGGMTGGDEIQYFEGIEAAGAASLEAYRYLQLLHRMQTDRQPIAVFRANGNVPSVEDFLKTSPIDYVPFNYYITANGGSDPFDVGDAPDFQVDHVSATGKKPPYENQLLGFAPYDYQHYARYTRSAKALTWLGNDTLAKEDLRLNAEIYAYSYHPFANSSGGQAQSSGMLNKIKGSAANPNVGTNIGRGEGWGLDAMAATYATANHGWRQKKLYWFEAVAELSSNTISTCNGFMQSFVTTKGIQGKYRVRQAIEHYIYENGMRGMLKSVLDGVTPAHQAMIEDVLRQTYYSSISDMAWEDGNHQPWSWTAVGPLDENLPPYCSASEMPADWHETWQEGHNIWNFGYAYELTGDTVFFDFAALASGGGGDALNNMLADELENIGNRAHSLAVLQLYGGIL